MEKGEDQGFEPDFYDKGGGNCDTLEFLNESSCSLRMVHGFVKD